MHQLARGALGKIEMRKDAAKNVIKIVKCLNEAESGWLWIREIARRCDLHHKTVSRLIDKHLSMFIETQPMEPFNVHMMRLKPDTDVKGIYRFLSIKEKIDQPLKKKKKSKVETILEEFK